eukprot:CAMPEP_0198568626 /NCGR_PEP_ID=MMETSP1462-20131121/106712_1 /TAXON_ID=1333877 /ORGANISM="Brandtodinium nutriculum, Strain RCC3387" /LENGTH=35 /DNA_ID= /DNA_START= /DNA_END= /DNA_ORIENTATION=
MASAASLQFMKKEARMNDTNLWNAKVSNLVRLMAE